MAKLVYPVLDIPWPVTSLDHGVVNGIILTVLETNKGGSEEFVMDPIQENSYYLTF